MRRVILPCLAVAALVGLLAYRQARLARGEAALGIDGVRRNGSSPEPAGVTSAASG
jgi:hypothetical protein